MGGGSNCRLAVVDLTRGGRVTKPGKNAVDKNEDVKCKLRSYLCEVAEQKNTLVAMCVIPLTALTGDVSAGITGTHAVFVMHYFTKTQALGCTKPTPRDD